MSLRLDSGLIVDPAPDGPRILEEASVLIEDGQIQAIGQDLGPADEVIDCTDCLVTPGLVNAHTHAAMVLLRGAADEKALEDWLREVIWPAEAAFTAETVRIGTQLAIAEMVAGGITAFADMYFFEDAVARAADEAGIRCLAGTTLADAGTPEHGPDELLEEAGAFLDRWPTPGERVRGAIAPHATYTCNPRTLTAAAEMSTTAGCRLHTHCSETRHEVYSVQGEHGRRPVDQLAEHGCLTDATILAHCGWITKAEVQTIAEAGAKVVHNPVANMKLATGGYAPVPEMLEAGVPVALGTDGAASNNRLDMFEAMKATALVHKHHRWQPEVLPAGQVLAMATRVGAQVLGWPAAGRVTEGALADLTVLDAKRPHMQPVHDPVSQIVYAARAGDVRTTIVGGDVVYHEGQHLTLDLEQVMAEAAREAERVAP